MSTINPYGTVIAGGGSNPFLTQQGKILSLPSNLQNLSYTSTVQGQVISQNKGVNQIQTSQGIVEIALRAALPVGTQIDVQISAGQPPRQATVQPTIVQTLKDEMSNNPTQPQKAESTSPQTASTQNIQDVKNLQNTAQQATILRDPLASSVLQQGQSVRLLSFPPSQQILSYIPNTRALPDLPVIQTQINTVSSSSAIISQITNGYIALQPPRAFPPLSPVGQFVSQFVDLTPVRVRSVEPLSIPQSSVVKIPDLQTFPQSGIHLSPVIASKQTTQIDAQVMSISSPLPLPSLGSSQSLQPNMKAGHVVATATGFVNMDGAPIVEVSGLGQSISASSGALAALQYPATNLPKGSQIILAPLSSQTIQTGQGTNISSSSSSVPQSLQIIFDELSNFLPTLQMTQALSLLPQAGQAKQFPAAALLFLAAAKGGDLSGWLGTRHIKSLDQSVAGKQALKLLNDSMATQSNRQPISSDPPMVQSGGDWRGMSLPLLFGGLLSEATLWTRYEDSQNQADHSNDKTTRFVVDLTLSRMGDLQVEGTITPLKKQFDIALVTQRELTKLMQDHVTQIWHRTLGGLGLDGQILYKVRAT